MDESKPIHCKHFVVRKKRYCRMTVKRGEEYCGEHQFEDPSKSNNQDDNSSESQKRIVCPLDPKHTCYANKLNKHLKKCNAKSTDAPPYMHKNVNAGEIDETNVNSGSRSLSSVPTEYFLEVISKVNKIHKDTVKDSISEKISSHFILEKELSNPEYGNSTRKHLLQTSSILGLLKEHNMLQSDTCYVEFGAGKGKLSYWVSKSLESLEYSSSSVLLIERASHRHKYDNKLDKTTGHVIRIRADIANLILSKTEIVTKTKHVFGLAKHLCGDATDLALRCLTNCQEAGKHVRGLIMAFCCHHRCQWSSYVGKQFFQEVGLTRSDFDVICGMVSWAVCGTGKSREYRQQSETNVNQNTRDQKLELTRDQKEEVGRKCKDLLNWGRKMYIQNCGFKSDLCYYINSDVSLENVCLIGLNENDVT